MDSNVDVIYNIYEIKFLNAGHTSHRVMWNKMFNLNKAGRKICILVQQKQNILTKKYGLPFENQKGVS